MSIQLTMEVLRKRKNGPVKVGEVEAWAPTLVFDGQWNSALMFIEIAGVPSARNAMWAHLMRRRPATSSDAPDPTSIRYWINGDEERINLAAKTKYQTVNIEDRIIVMHPDFKKDRRVCFVGGSIDEPSPFFAEALRMNSNIPFMPEHIPALWKIAIEERAITAMNSYGGLFAWQVSGQMHDSIVPRLKEVVCG